MPAATLLDAFANDVAMVFDQTCYLVGSAVISKTWRDVDVRIVLEDDEFDRWFGPSDRIPPCMNRRWAVLMSSISLLGRQMTGLPIDFQVQRRSNIGESNWDKPRMALGIFPTKQPWHKEDPE
jgi:hypothetical protein